MAKLHRFWIPITVLLVAVIITGGIIIWSRYSPSQPIEIFLPAHAELQGEIYISGAVNNPGVYTLRAEDSLEDIIQAAGGATGNA